MSTHNIYFCKEIKKYQHFLVKKKCLIWGCVWNYTLSVSIGMSLVMQKKGCLSFSTLGANPADANQIFSYCSANKV